ASGLEPSALFVVTTGVIRDEERARVLLGGLWVGGLVAALPNLFVIEQAARHHTLNLALAAPVVIYNNVNELALYLVPLAAVAGAVALHAADLWLRRAAALSFLVSGAALLASFSRGGYMAAAAVLLLLALSLPARLWLVPLLAVLGFLVSRLPP